MCVAGDACVLVGDGAGQLLCYDMLSAEGLAAPSGASSYYEPAAGGSFDAAGARAPAAKQRQKPAWDDGSGSVGGRGGGGSRGAPGAFSGGGAVKYGLGASRSGAVRTINCLNGKVVTGGEDGKALIFTFS